MKSINKFATLAALAFALVGCGPCPVDTDADAGDPDVVVPDAADSGTADAQPCPDATPDAGPVCENYTESRGTIVNVALVRPATQDTTFTVSGGLHTANFAVDGYGCFGTSDRFAFNTETASGSQVSWWEVDLQSNYRLDNVVIHGWAWGAVLGTTVNGMVEFYDCNHDLVASVPFGMVQDYPGLPTTIRTDARARYVRIRRVTNEVPDCGSDSEGRYHANCTLSLCEVEVNAHI